MSTKELQEIKFPENDVAEVKEKAAITIPKMQLSKLLTLQMTKMMRMK